MNAIKYLQPHKETTKRLPQYQNVISVIHTHKQWVTIVIWITQARIQRLEAPLR